MVRLALGATHMPLRWSDKRAQHSSAAGMNLASSTKRSRSSRLPLTVSPATAHSWS